MYKLTPEKNIVLIGSSKAPTAIVDYIVERRLSELTGWNVQVLVKQPFVDENGEIDSTRFDN